MLGRPPSRDATTLLNDGFIDLGDRRMVGGRNVVVVVEEAHQLGDSEWLAHVAAWRKKLVDLAEHSLDNQVGSLSRGKLSGRDLGCVVPLEEFRGFERRRER